MVTIGCSEEWGRRDWQSQTLILHIKFLPYFSNYRQGFIKIVCIYAVVSWKTVNNVHVFFKWKTYIIIDNISFWKDEPNYKMNSEAESTHKTQISTSLELNLHSPAELGPISQICVRYWNQVEGPIICDHVCGVQKFLQECEYIISFRFYEHDFRKIWIFFRMDFNILLSLFLSYFQPNLLFT